MKDLIKGNKNIYVCIRKKPTKNYEKDMIKVIDNNLAVIQKKMTFDHNFFNKKTHFQFDKVFEGDISNKEIFQTCKPVMENVMNGDNGTIIAYGEMGTGKTYTMFNELDGVIFESIKEWLKIKKMGFIIFTEVYNGHIYDLLNNRRKVELKEKEECVFFSEISKKRFNSLEDAFDIIRKGLLKRMIGKTGANKGYSRSHAILRISSSFESMNNEDNSMNFVDLAGSGRGRHNIDDDRLTKTENIEINKSLFALNECIRAIRGHRMHLPFRQSKLTQVLKNSLIGNSKTIFIATINSSAGSVNYTLNTLKYAFRLHECCLNNYKCAKNRLNNSLSNQRTP